MTQNQSEGQAPLDEVIVPINLYAFAAMLAAVAPDERQAVMDVIIAVCGASLRVQR